MKELSLNILDIAQNSITAGASLVTIDVVESNGMLTIAVTDDGRGMDSQLLASVTDPFTTTRTTRKVGMGIPLLKMVAEMAGGGLDIQSQPGRGTKITATFRCDSIDLPPLGDLASTMATLVQGSQTIDFLLQRGKNGREYDLDTRQLRQIMGDIPLGEPEILEWIKDYIHENENELDS